MGNGPVQSNENCMKRRTLRQLRAKLMPELHHNVYVVLLKPAVGKIRKVRAANPKRDPKKPCIYVGMTGLPAGDEPGMPNNAMSNEQRSFLSLPRFPALSLLEAC